MTGTLGERCGIPTWIGLGWVPDLPGSGLDPQQAFQMDQGHELFGAESSLDCRVSEQGQLGPRSSALSRVFGFSGSLNTGGSLGS